MQKTVRVFNKTLSFILCLAMVFGISMPLFSKNVFAADDGTDALHLEKSYDPNTGLLTLQSYVTGETITTTRIEVAPTDITLILDVTESMDWDCNIATKAEHLAGLCKDYAGEYKYHSGLFSNKDVRWNSSGGVWEYESKKNTWTPITDFKNKYVYTSRITALKAAATEFVRNVAKESPESRIAIVTFGSFKSRKSEAEVKSPFTFCNQSGVQSLVSTLASIEADKASTAQSTGIVAAMDLIKATIESDKTAGISALRGKDLVLFTDGEPVAEDYDDGIEAAYNAKNSADIPNIKLFTIGLFDSDSGNDTDNYMNYMSSKYPKATSMNSHGSAVEGQFYYPVTDSDSINNVFDNISKDILVGRPKIEILDKETRLHDVISDSFVFDNSDDNKVHVYTSDYTGENQWKTPVEIFEEDGIEISYDPATCAVDVTGFDYSDNWCGIGEDGKYRGKKIIVTIPIKPKDGVIGGNNINTNGPGSGIIPPGENEPLGDDFPVPYTDLPESVPVKAVFDGSLYPIADDFKFDVKAEVNGFITGYDAPDADNYTKAVAGIKDYSFTFDKTNKQYDGINNLLVSSEGRKSTVTVKLSDVSPDYEVTIADNKGTSQTFTGGGNISKTFDVKEGQEITVTYKKIAANRTDVTVTTAVGGNCSDRTQPFILGGSYVKAGASQTISESVKHGDTVTFTNVDVGSEFEISQEAVAGYVTTVKVNGEELKPESGVYKFTVNDNDSVEIYNYANIEVPVGVSLDFAIPVLIMIFVTVVAFIFVKKQLLKRRLGEEL